MSEKNRACKACGAPSGAVIWCPPCLAERFRTLPAPAPKAPLTGFERRLRNGQDHGRR